MELTRDRSCARRSTHSIAILTMLARSSSFFLLLSEWHGIHCLKQHYVRVRSASIQNVNISAVDTYNVELIRIMQGLAMIKGIKAPRSCQSPVTQGRPLMRTSVAHVVSPSH